ncbi:type IV pilin protein [Chondromyces apiculatus]|uniref:type IV pilin protein n=1 Tax=Chondromyces apiculatus TaxID=51 RepID=UPI0005C76B06|nr:type II secretion system protein [Chondromyces apiculatus]
MESTTRRRRIGARGFTLVELLAVVAMIGILAAIALVGYRRYMNSAGSAEATAVIQGIRGAEEAYKAEMLVYLGCSGCGQPQGCEQGQGSLTTWYPMDSPNSQKSHWVNPGHSDQQCWRLLNVVTDGPVRFGYAVVAGTSSSISVALPPFSSPPTFPAVNEPWYVITARGDRDEDGTPALFIASSLRGEVYSENDSE